MRHSIAKIKGGLAIKTKRNAKTAPTTNASTSQTPSSAKPIFQPAPDGAKFLDCSITTLVLFASPILFLVRELLGFRALCVLAFVTLMATLIKYSLTNRERKAAAQDDPQLAATEDFESIRNEQFDHPNSTTGHLQDDLREHQLSIERFLAEAGQLIPPCVGDNQIFLEHQAYLSTLSDSELIQLVSRTNMSLKQFLEEMESLKRLDHTPGLSQG